MDVVNALLLVAASVLVGGVLTLILQYYVLVRYFQRGALVEPGARPMNNEAFTLPEEIKKKLESNEHASALPIALLLQFLFHELRHSEAVKRWLYKKLSMEFDELLTKTTIGKFFEAVTIRDVHLGSQFPDINEITLDSIKLDKADGHIDTLNLSVQLDYTGNFLLSVDAKMKFGKTAYLSIKVKRINGVGRLQFTRIPYTHWSFSFFDEPAVELAVESHFQGRQLQSNITNLIVNQIKKAIKRKHTLPNYKIRYKPFFVKTDPGADEESEELAIPSGRLEVSCGDVSRLDAPADVEQVFCTLTVDALPFVCVYTRDNALWLIMELTLTKARQTQLGIIFKQETNGTVTVESVTPSTPAADAGLRAADVIVAIDNKNVSNVSQIGKIIKASAAVNVSFKIERCTSSHAFKHSSGAVMTTRAASEERTPAISLNDEEVLLNDAESFVMVDAKPQRTPNKTLGNENMSSKFAQTLGNFTLRKRRSLVDPRGGSGSEGNSNRSTPTPSCPSTPQHTALKQPPVQFPTKKLSIAELPEITRTDTDVTPEEILTQVYKSKELPLKSLMHFGDDYNFSLNEASKYLNVNVWGSSGQREVLLGYTNIPLDDVLRACCDSLWGHHTRSFSFLPPNNTPPNVQSHPLMSHSGFEHVFCYGDILLSFVWHHADDAGLKRKNSAVCEPGESCSKPATRKQHAGSQHDFVRTQFHRSIHCDFCSKKIWLKDAVQCRDCGMCCHKKCISKCQGSSECKPPGTSPTSSTVTGEQPELIIDAIDDSSLDDDAGMDASVSNIKRVNSVNNLSIPGAHHKAAQSRSLPPSPQRTPTRKHSLMDVTHPFALCPAALEEIGGGGGGDAHDAVNRLLDQMLACAADEQLMEAARESGRQLYATMLPDEKIDKINAMMVELKKVFDIVTTEHADLIKRLNAEDAEVERARLAFLLGQADAKIHGLSVLMLHYCSGLQQS